MTYTLCIGVNKLPWCSLFHFQFEPLRTLTSPFSLYFSVLDEGLGGSK